jgi:hypothetical protein
MRKFVIAHVVGLAVLTSAPLPFALAHEGAQMECNEMNINAMNADVQAMNDEETKTTAMKEMKMAEAMMGLKDINACMAHMHNAIEAIEK